MYLDEEIIHYVARFLDHYDVQNKLHKQSVKQLRQLSDQLIEHLYVPENIIVRRKEKPKES